MAMVGWFKGPLPYKAPKGCDVHDTEKDPAIAKVRALARQHRDKGRAFAAALVGVPPITTDCWLAHETMGTYAKH